MLLWIFFHGLYLEIFPDYFLPISLNSLTVFYPSPSSAPSTLSRETPSDPMDTLIFRLLILPSNVLHYRFFLFFYVLCLPFLLFLRGYIQCSQQCNILPILWNALFFVGLYLLWEMLHSLPRHFECLATITFDWNDSPFVVLTYCFLELKTYIGLVSPILFAYP